MFVCSLVLMMHKSKTNRIGHNTARNHKTLWVFHPFERNKVYLLQWIACLASVLDSASLPWWYPILVMLLLHLQPKHSVMFQYNFHNFDTASYFGPQWPRVSGRRTYCITVLFKFKASLILVITYTQHMASSTKHNLIATIFALQLKH